MLGLRLLAILCALCASAATPAMDRTGALDRLDRFITATRTAQGEFQQRIYDRGGKLVQSSSGTLAFQRPGRFRWSYVKPYPQLIVGDGERVWVYDEDLKQVTVRKLDVALGATPAALLAGDNAALRAFALQDEGVQDGLAWLAAAPRDRESGFERIRMGFGPEGLARMELTDAFGQRTELVFTALERNPRLGPEMFSFAPPPGADVIGDR
ncbi:MAG: outer membrane lipoprotein chaperone LolA [Burkholderiales bacterium]|nr:outer membrane lipoprotein chaperone LolA [Burkholderiales bacterium]